MSRYRILRADGTVAVDYLDESEAHGERARLNAPMSGVPSQNKPYRVQRLVASWEDVPEPVDPRIEVVARLIDRDGAFLYARDRAKKILAALDAMPEDDR